MNGAAAGGIAGGLVALVLFTMVGVLTVTMDIPLQEELDADMREHCPRWIEKYLDADLTWNVELLVAQECLKRFPGMVPEDRVSELIPIGLVAEHCYHDTNPHPDIIPLAWVPDGCLLDAMPPEPHQPRRPGR